MYTSLGAKTKPSIPASLMIQRKDSTIITIPPAEQDTLNLAAPGSGYGKKGGRTESQRGKWNIKLRG